MNFTAGMFRHVVQRGKNDLAKASMLTAKYVPKFAQACSLWRDPTQTRRDHHCCQRQRDGPKDAGLISAWPSEERKTHV